jgi:hypothetical protein
MTYYPTPSVTYTRPATVQHAAPNWYEVIINGERRTVFGTVRADGMIQYMPDTVQPRPAPSSASTEAKPSTASTASTEASPSSASTEAPRVDPKTVHPIGTGAVNYGVDIAALKSDSARVGSLTTNDPELGSTLGLDRETDQTEATEAPSGRLFKPEVTVAIPDLKTPAIILAAAIVLAVVLTRRPEPQ